MIGKLWGKLRFAITLYVTTISFFVITIHYVNIVLTPTVNSNKRIRTILLCLITKIILKINFVNGRTINRKVLHLTRAPLTHNIDGKRKPGTRYNPVGLLPLPTQSISKSVHK